MATPLDDDELTELYDADIPRVDLVGKGANGIPRFLIMKGAEDGPSLFDADYVRDLVAKAEPAPVPTPDGPVTVTASPASMAAFIHKASERAEATFTGAEILQQAAAIQKAKNDTADRKKKAGTGAAMSNGSYPIANEADLTKAIRAVGRGGSSHGAIRKHIISRAKSLGASSKIPDNWNSDGSLKGDSVSKTAGDVAPVVKDIGPDLDGDPDASDGMDLTTPLAEPDDDAPGDATDPGSPAWEAIDAATAQKWTSIAVRLKNALAVMAEREMVEAATADPDDAGNAFDLEDAMCAIDFAIDTLASFAVGEQAESTLGAEDMDAIGKAMTAFDPDQADLLEGLSAIAKSGRVLSSANEARIRDAAASLQNVLASLPSAPQTTDSGLVVAKEKEAVVAATSTEPEAVTEAAPVEKAEAPAAPEVTPEPAAVTAPAGDAREIAKAGLRSAVYIYHGDGTQAGLVDPGQIVQQVAKADAPPDGKPSMQAVFDQDGNLVGIVDPSAITPVSGAGSKADPEPDPTPPVDDTDPQSPADAGTPADAPVAKAADEASETAPGDTPDFVTAVTKSVSEAMQAAFAAQSASHEETVAKQATVIGELTGQIDVLKGRVEEIASEPAMPKVFTNGQTPPPGTLRGQDQGSAPVDVAKAQELKGTLYHGTAQEQNKAFNEMQAMAIDRLADIRRR